MKRILKLTAILLILSTQYAVSAEQYWFNHYLSTDGLPSNTIYSVVQDKYNFIWIATRDGICRFDGHSFISLDDYVPGGEASGMTPALCFDDDGGLWFANGKGAGCYNIDTGEILSLGLLEEDDIFQIFSDKAGNIWFLATDIHRYNKESGTVTRYPGSEYFYPLSIASDQLGTVWLNSDDGGLYRYDSRTDSFERQAFEGINLIAGTASPFLLASTTDNDVVLLDTGTESVRTLFHYDEPRVIRCILERVPGEYWIGTETGIFVCDGRDDSVAHIFNSATDPHSISASYIMSLTADREGNIWAGTFYKGLNLWLNKRDSYQLFYVNEAPGSIRGSIVRSICPAPSGALWLGTEDGTLDFFDPRTREITYYAGHEDGFINIQDVMRIGWDLWIATYGNGLFVYRPSLKRNVAHYEFSSNVIRQCQLKDGTIVVGTVEGLYRYVPDTDSFEQVEVLNDNFVHALYQDSKGNLWVGTYGRGIWLLDDKLELISRINTLNNGNGLKSNHITSFLEDSSHRMWITTEGGGVSVTAKDWTPREPGLRNLGKDDGLPSNIACAIAEDRNGKLWISTTHGLAQLDPETWSLTTSYFEESHVTVNQYSYGAAYTAPNGTVYMGSTDGLTAFSPAMLNTMVTNGNLMISGITARTQDKVMQLSTPGHSYYTSDRIKASHKDITTLEISFAAPDFSNILSTEYEYTMRHGRNTLKETTTAGKAIFTGMVPGKYVFNVGIVGDGRPEAHKTLEITIRPPFYASAAAKLLYLLLALTLIYLIFRALEHRRQIQRESQMAMLENEKQKEIYDTKIQYFTNLTHEIRTPLTLIKMPVDKIIANEGYKDSSKEDMLTIQSNTERLLELTNQLLDLRKMEQKELKLHFEEKDIKPLLGKTCDYFATTIQERHIAMNIDMPDGPVSAMCDPDGIEKILTNLISNAVKYGKDRIDVSLTDDTSEGKVVIRMDSNGPIIAEKDSEKIFEPFYQVKMVNVQIEGSKGTGLGLPFARTLAEMHGGKLYLDKSRKDVNSFVLEIPKQHVSDPEVENKATVPAAESCTEASLDTDYSRHSILIVEDSADMRNYLGKELSADYNTLLASNGEEALAMAKEQKVDLIISDIMMPVMDGCELCNRIKSDVELCHIPVILLTAAIGVETRIDSLRMGADGYIEKPFSIDLLKANIDNLFKNKEISFKQFTESPLSHYSSMTTGTVDNDFMERLHAEVMNHLSEQDLNIESLTAILGTSKSTLYRKVKAYTGLNINEYIRLCRLKEAAEMLASQKYRINEVAYLVGFSSPSYFTTSFQKQFDISPSAFVKRIRQEK